MGLEDVLQVLGSWVSWFPQPATAARSSLVTDVIDFMIRKSSDRWWKTLKNMMKLMILPISLWVLLVIANNIAMENHHVCLWEHELQMGRFRLSYHYQRVPSQQVWASSRSFAYFVFTQLQYLHHSAIHQEAWWVSFDSKSTKGEFTIVYFQIRIRRIW